MREILSAIDRGESRARLAFDIYTHRLLREIGAMLAVLGGADALVFTGGVGENCAPLRERVTQQLGFLPNLQVLVIHAEEEWEIARQCFELMQPRLLRNRNRLLAVDVADILRPLRGGDVLRSRLLPVVGRPLRGAVGLARRQGPHANRTSAAALRPRQA